MRTAFPALWLLAVASLAAMDRDLPDYDRFLSQEQDDRAKVQDIQAAAADYRLDLVRLAPGLPKSYHDHAGLLLDRSVQAFEAGEIALARGLARRGLGTYPYSRSAAGFLHVLARSHLATDDLFLARNELALLWFRHPDYGGTPGSASGTAIAFAEAAMVAELVQGADRAINFSAASPEQWVDFSLVGDTVASDRLFRLLAKGGDQRDVKPRAHLGLARSRLLTGSREHIIQARADYESFRADFPGHPLVFRALCEYALTYVVLYRGSHYDGGALDRTDAILSQAEEYTAGDPGRVGITRRLRTHVMACRQQHDLQIARWYRKQDEVFASRYYYQAVVNWDSATPHAQTARQEMAELPPP